MSSEKDPSDPGLPEDRPVPVPEDYLGSTMMINGVEYRLDGIEAIGSKVVVFRARNTATNTVDLVAKVPRSEFDPRQPLLEALPIAVKDLDQNPDRVIRICERLLKLDPTMEAAAFNLGIACYQKKISPVPWMHSSAPWRWPRRMGGICCIEPRAWPCWAGMRSVWRIFGKRRKWWKWRATGFVALSGISGGTR
jgi:hypothetical protein